MGYAVVKTELSPMMQRYVEYKERYPDALLFFQVGDFYELFFEDAVTVAKALNLTLTSRDKNAPNPIPMCGVPLSVIDGYVDRLLPQGFSVAIVTQSGSGQGVDRALERFVTPGMRLFNSVASDAAESLIAAVALDPGAASGAIACTDPQTGIVRVKDAIEVASLARELANLMVREVVLPRSSHGEKLDRRSSWVRAIEGTINSNALKFRLEPTTSSDSDYAVSDAARTEIHSLSPTGKRAVRLLLSYVDEVSLGNPIPVREVSLLRAAGSVIIDAATRRNLELVQNTRDGSASGSLYGFLNRTATPGGARLLRNWVLGPLTSIDAITARHSSVRELLASYSETSAALQGLSDLERLAARIQIGIASPKDLGAVRDTFERLPRLRDVLSRCRAALLQDVCEALEPPKDAVSLLRDSLVDTPPHHTNEGEIIRPGYDQELDEIRTLRTHADEWRASFEQRERQASGINTLKVKSNNVIGFFIEVPTSQGTKAPAHYQRRQSTANAERFTTPELKQHEDAVVTALDRQIRREQQLFSDVRQKMFEHVDTLRVIAAALAQLDVLSSLAEVAERCGWVAPSLYDASTLQITKGRHPIIADLLEGAFIPNSVSFPEGGATCYIVTGPNMGGKSTYLRQAALIVILAQIGSFVPAQAAQIGLVDRIFARLGAADDLHEGESTFMVEMREAAQILAHASSRSLVLIDELGRGTATTDGLSLAHAIVEQLVNVIGCRTLFATHYHELTRLADEASSKVQNLSVGSVEEEDRVVFTHEIQAGPAPRSYGLEVAKLSGLPQNVITRAYELLSLTPQPEASARSRETARQIGLFNAPQPPKRDPKIERLLASLEALDIDAMTPRDALSTLYDLKGIIARKA
jgi:DNA mismatch repair protein MutS